MGWSFPATKLSELPQHTWVTIRWGNLPRYFTTHHCWYEDPTSLGPKLESHSLLWIQKWTFIVFCSSPWIALPHQFVEKVKSWIFANCGDCINILHPWWSFATMEMFMPTIPSSKHGLAFWQTIKWMTISLSWKLSISMWDQEYTVYIWTTITLCFNRRCSKIASCFKMDESCDFLTRSLSENFHLFAGRRALPPTHLQGLSVLECCSLSQWWHCWVKVWVI